ncbi:MAG: 5'/3'-nucleotidase SurE [Anaerolineales bacterium]|nr:MAG: 5'/3'-nucleotidase SurE [Anaerolineales bacterium]
MKGSPPPLILVTSDDGIGSLGLRAAVEAVLGLGDVLVVAPDRQWSGGGRSLPAGMSGVITEHPMELDGYHVDAFGVDASPALALIHGLLELAPRQPALVICGINCGENLGTDVTSSGTVGAALQAATHGVPALAISLETAKQAHREQGEGIDFRAAAHFCRQFAGGILEVELPFDVDILKVDVPDRATPETAWRLTRLSRFQYYESLPPERVSLADRTSVDYRKKVDPEEAEPDSDIYALRVDSVVSVTPLSIDLTSRVDPADLLATLGPAIL